MTNNDEIRVIKQIKRLTYFLLISMIIAVVSTLTCINLYNKYNNIKQQSEALQAADTQQQNVNTEINKYIEIAFSIDGMDYQKNIKQLRDASSEQVYEQLLSEDCTSDVKTECVDNPIYIQKTGENEYIILSPITTHTIADGKSLGNSTEIWQFEIKYSKSSDNKEWNIKVVEMHPANRNYN